LECQKTRFVLNRLTKIKHVPMESASLETFHALLAQRDTVVNRYYPVILAKWLESGNGLDVLMERIGKVMAAS